MYSLSVTQPVESSEEIIRINVYDDNGYLPIHRAAFNGQEVTIKNILDDAQKRNELSQQLEALTHDTHEFTPLLLATAAGRLETIACLLEYPVNLHAVDADGHGLAAIAVLSQNERTLRYIIDLPRTSEEYNVWKPLFKLFLSINDEESVVCGHMLELLTRRQSTNSDMNPYWLPMIENGFLSTLVQIYSLSKNDELLTSALILLLNILNEIPDVKNELKLIRNSFSSLLKHTRSTTTQILTLLGRILACLSTEKSLIESMVEQGLIESLMHLIDKQRSPQIISSYFDCLANVLSYSSYYQQKIAYSKDFLSLIIKVYLEDYDLTLSLSVIRFIRQLVKNNETIQNTLAHYGACEHLLGALTASSKELQQVSIEAIQALSHRNTRVQQILLDERAIEQLLSLLEKTNLSNLQIAIVCTLWTLCENNLSRKREVATKIGVRKLISFYTLKSDEHLLAVTEALNELAKCPASIKMNIQEEINQAQGIPYLVRLLKLDDQTLVLSVLKTLQLISCAPGFVANRTNQDIIIKNDGITLIVALMMHAKTEIIQVEAAQALACIALSNKQSATTIENTLDFSYSHLIHLMESDNSDVQIKASEALSTFTYNNPRLYSYISHLYQFSFHYFEKFLQSTIDSIRCTAAFQLVVLSNLIPEQRPSVNTAIACGILIDVLRLSQNDQAKSIAAEYLARLAHMKSVSEVHKYTGVPQALIAVNAIDYLCNLFSSSNDITIGNAAIALGFLSYIPEGHRKLLNRCRSEPDIMSFLKIYNCLPGKPQHLSNTLMEDWDRYHTLNFPKLQSQQQSNIRYFKVFSTHIERCRAPPNTDNEKEQTVSSNTMKFYLPPIRQKVEKTSSITV